MHISLFILNKNTSKATKHHFSKSNLAGFKTRLAMVWTQWVFSKPDILPITSLSSSQHHLHLPTLLIRPLLRRNHTRHPEKVCKQKGSCCNPHAPTQKKILELPTLERSKFDKYLLFIHYRDLVHERDQHWQQNSWLGSHSETNMTESVNKQVRLTQARHENSAAIKK